MIKRPQLLSPAGNMEKLRAAVRYGADAVYLAGKGFGMRAAADNFTEEELAAAVEYAHARGVKVYLTVNTMPHEGEYADLRRYLCTLRAIPVDALIVGDIGVLFLAREVLPDVHAGERRFFRRLSCVASPRRVPHRDGAGTHFG